MSDAESFVDSIQEWIDIFMRRSMHKFIRYTKENGLSMSQIGALFHIHRLGSIGVSDLGEHLGVTSAAASQLLDRLVQQELILRTEDPNDRRGKQIFLTDNGRQVLQDGINARQGWLLELERNLSASEKEQIIAALKILIDKARYSNQLNKPEC